MSGTRTSSWLDELQPASWRGLSFGVNEDSYRRGRKLAVHEYPFRDDPWPEDLGRATREYRFSGFVVGDDCHAQAQALLDKAEIPGSGQLIHPSLGALSVVLLEPMEARERKDLGRVVEIEFVFISSGLSIFPASFTATDDSVLVGAGFADTAVTGDWLTQVEGALAEGVQVVDGAVQTVQGWASSVIGAVNDASLLVSAVASIPGNFGRFITGAIGAVVDSVLAVGETVEGAVESAIVSVLGAGQAVVGLVDGVFGLAGGLAPNVDNGFCARVQASHEALRTACMDPADAVRLLSSLAAQPLAQSGYEQTTLAAMAPAPIGSAILLVQTAMQGVFRRAALTSLARACSTYQPSSYDDAVTVISTVAPLFDAEILVAADAGQDATYQALRSLRAAVVADLFARGADLARLTTITTTISTPSLTLAYRLYRDASRADDLAARAHTPAPLFMPLSFQALAT